MMQWVLNSPELSQAFILAENGYDVWMGNNRGSKYGLNHTHLSPYEREFYRYG